MKKHKIVFYLVLLLVFSCKTEDFFVDPVPVETPELKTAMSSVQQAFTNADTAKIRTLILPNYFNLYRNSLQMNQNKLNDFGKLLKDMELVSGDSVFMIYKVKYQKSQYEISFSKDEKGNWKIMNF